MTKRVRGFGLTTVGIGCIVILGAASVAHSSRQVLQEPRLDLQQARAFQTGGLHGAATVTGSYVVRRSPARGGGPGNLKELVDLSHLVVVGDTEENLCHLTADGSSIVTVFRVRVESVLKGDWPNGGPVSVVIPGGRFRFADGTWAQVDTPGFLKPMGGFRYVWFLRARHPEDRTTAFDTVGAGEYPYVLTSGPLGLYDLSQRFGVYVRPAGNVGSVLAKKLYKEKLDPAAFLERVRADAGKR